LVILASVLSLKAKIREPKENLEKMRKAGELPAVLYGLGVEATPISVPLVEFKKVWHQAGESSTVKIVTPKTAVDVLIHEIQHNPVTGEPIHADFLAIDVNRKIKVEIPLEFVGVSSVVKSGLGILVKVLHEVEVEALPKDLPHSLTVDISKLENLDSQILASDIHLPKEITLLTKTTEVVASITEQKEEKFEEPVPVDLSAIEVEKKGKQDLPAQAGGEGETVETAPETKPEEKKGK